MSGPDPGRAFRRSTTWIALTLIVVVLAMIVAGLASVLGPGSERLPDRPDPLSVLASLLVVVTLSTVGAVLAIMRPGNAIGWLFLVCGLCFTMGIYANEHVQRSIYVDPTLPAAPLVDWIGALATSVALFIPVVFLPLLFPDGRPPGPKWRIFAVLAAVALCVTVVANAIAPDTEAGYAGVLANPFGVGGPLGELTGPVLAVMGPIGIILAIASAASLVVRFRRSRGVERQQIKWFLLAVVVLAATFVVGITTSIEWVWYIILACFAALPITAGLAVMRYRLYEIDRIISRTVSYAIVTVTLAVIFVSVVLGLQAVMAPVTQNDTLAVAASTLVVAALFQPLRGRVQRVVDRRFDRARYDGERLVDAFGRRLREEVDLDRLRGDLVATTEATIRPSGVGLWIRQPESPR